MPNLCRRNKELSEAKKMKDWLPKQKSAWEFPTYYHFPAWSSTHATASPPDPSPAVNDGQPLSTPLFCSSPKHHGIARQRAAGLILSCEWLLCDLLDLTLNPPSWQETSAAAILLHRENFSHQQWDLRLPFPCWHCYFMGKRLFERVLLPLSFCLSFETTRGKTPP